MAELNLFIDTTANQLIAGLNNPVPVSPSQQLPLFVGDTVNLKIWLLQNAGPAQLGASPYTVIPNQGLQLVLYITDGANGGTIYTQQVVFNQDAGGQFFSGSVSLNTPALTSQFTGSTKSINPQLIIGYLSNGLQTTVLSQAITITLGLPNNAVPQAPPGLTPLSAEAAAQTYVPIAGKAGQPIILISPAGKKIMLLAVDQPDGTASFQANPIN